MSQLMSANKTISDEELAQRAADSDLNAFEELIKRYEKNIYRLAFRITGHRENAEEVMQDIFVCIFKNLKSFRGDSSFKTWLYRVATNSALMNLRVNKKFAETTSNDTVDSDSTVYSVSAWPDTPEALYEREELSEFIQSCVDSLEEKYRTVFILRDVEGFSTQETADILNISLPAVKSRILRARLKLRELLAGYFSGTIDRGKTP